MTDRLRRAIRLLMLLRHADGLTVREITASLDCSRRTAYRDLRTLKESGFEIDWSREGYRLASDEDFPRASVEGDELQALLAVIHASPLWQHASLRSHAQRALQKLFASSSLPTRRRWRQIARQMNLHTAVSRRPAPSLPTRHQG